MYSKTWTQFETQSLAFGMLRKALYPHHLVRGYDQEIWIYRPTVDATNPTLKLILRIENTTDATQSRVEKIGSERGVPILVVAGGDKAYSIVDIIRPYL